MARKTDDLKIAQIKRAYLAGEGTLSALALRFGLGERTLKRFSAEGNWESLKLARETVVTQTVRDRVLRYASPSFWREYIVIFRESFSHLELAPTLPLFLDTSNTTQQARNKPASPSDRLLRNAPSLARPKHPWAPLQT